MQMNLQQPIQEKEKTSLLLINLFIQLEGIFVLSAMEVQLSASSQTKTKNEFLHMNI